MLGDLTEVGVGELGVIDCDGGVAAVDHECLEVSTAAEEGGGTSWYSISVL